MHIVQLIYPTRDWEFAFKDADFSVAAIEERWELGHRDAARMLELRPWARPVPSNTAVVLHTLRPDDLSEEMRDPLLRALVAI